MKKPFSVLMTLAVLMFSALTGTPESFEQELKKRNLKTLFKRMQVNEIFSWK